MLFEHHFDVAGLFKLITRPIYNKAVYIKGSLKGFDEPINVESASLNIV